MRLDVNNNPITASAASALVDLARVQPNLWVLNLNDNSLPFFPSFVPPLRHLAPPSLPSDPPPPTLQAVAWCGWT